MSLRRELINATLQCPLTGKEYIPLGVIQEKITAKRVLEKLPTPSWYTRWLYPCWDYDLENKLRAARKAVAVLVLTGKCGFLEPLLAEKLTDSDLPLRKDGSHVKSRCGKKIFSSFRNCEDHEDLAEMFLEKQWAVLAPDLEFEADKVIDIPLDPHCALPFISYKEISMSPFSMVYKAKLDPSHCWARETVGPTWVAIKKLSRQDSEAFRHERENLDHVRSIKNDHLISHLAVCEEAKCIIFPWANGGTLWSFWESHGQEKLERTAGVYRWFLEQLAGLAHAMSELHSENFRHGDLKPTNILRFNLGGDELGTLKIADVGVSKMHKGASTNLRFGPTLTTASTLTYQAPEACDVYKTNKPRSRRYDSWSMGCIILEFVVWLLYDIAALESFRGARNDARETYYRIKAGSNPQDGTDKAHEVHPEVREAIRQLESDDRCRDTALGTLVRLVESHILKILPQDRLHLAELHEKLNGILEDAETPLYLFNAADPPSPVPDIFSRPPPAPSVLESTHGRG